MSNKTLVLTENFPPISGGSGRWFWELYSRLPNNDYIIVADDSSEGSEFDKGHHLNVLRVPLNSSEWGFRSWQGIKFYYRAFNQLRKTVKRHNITHIHAGRVIHEGVLAYLLKIFCGIKYICYVHGEDVETASTSGEHNLMVKHVCKHAEVLICNSKNTAEIVKRLGYGCDENIEIIHPGVDASKFIPTKPDKEFQTRMGWTDKKVILTVGRLQQRKGQDRMIEAMPKIIEKNPQAIYVIIGDGECKVELQALISKLNLKGAVQLLGEVSDDDMISCYQQCDLFLLPNRTIGNDIEGFGMVLVEAQSCGKTVIAGDSGGTKETMVVGETGLIIDCTLPDKISGAICQLLHQPETIIEMGIKARLHVERNLDWIAHVEKAQKTFNNI